METVFQCFNSGIEVEIVGSDDHDYIDALGFRKFHLLSKHLIVTAINPLRVEHEFFSAFFGFFWIGAESTSDQFIHAVHERTVEVDGSDK